MLTGVLLAACQGMQLSASASDTSSAIGVTPVASKSQKGSFNGYFSVLVKPKQVEDLEFTVSNNSNKEVTVDVTTETARTNQQMQVDYGSSKLKSSKNAPIDINKAIQGPRTLVLKPHATQQVKYQLTMPAKFIDGVVAGGFTFQERPEKTGKESSRRKEPTVHNRYNYVIGLVLAESDKYVKADLKMDAVQLAQWNNRNALSLTMTAPTGNIIKDLDTKVEVVNKKTNQSTMDISEKKHNIAPYSTFDWKLPLGDQKKWEAGEYVVKVDVQNDDYQWHFEKDLTITDGEAKKYNEDDVTLRDNTMMYVILVLLIIVLGIAGYILWKKYLKK